MHGCRLKPKGAGSEFFDLSSVECIAERAAPILIENTSVQYERAVWINGEQTGIKSETRSSDCKSAIIDNKGGTSIPLQRLPAAVNISRSSIKTDVGSVLRTASPRKCVAHIECSKTSHRSRAVLKMKHAGIAIELDGIRAAVVDRCVKCAGHTVRCPVQRIEPIRRLCAIPCIGASRKAQRWRELRGLPRTSVGNSGSEI